MSGIPLRCAALFSAAALTGVLSGPPNAVADDFSRVDRDPVAGSELVLSDGREVDTALYSLRVADQDSVRAYTVAVDDEVRPRTAYVESAWADNPQWTETARETGSANRANWIVSHSYPNVDLPVLALSAESLDLDEERAIAGTQAALWHVLDGVEFDPGANDDAVNALYDHLVEGSDDAAENTTVRSLEVTPAQVEAVAPQDPLGPLTVASSGTGPVRVSLLGAPASWLVDAVGSPVTQARDGDQVYLDVDPSVPAGVVTVHVRGHDVPLPEGRLFTGRDGARTQPLITAEPGSATSSTTATFTWHPERTEEPEPEDEAVDPSPEAESASRAEEVPDTVPTDENAPEADGRIPDEDLASTGTWLSGLLIIAGALLVSGLLILVLGRKKRD